MAVDLFANAAATTLAASSLAGATSLTVTSSTLFPAASTAASTQFRVLIDSELMIVTNVSGTTWTVTPAAEGTVAAAHTAGAAITAIATAAGLQSFRASSVYGGASDGSATISTAITVYRDMLYQDLVIANGGVLNMNGFRLFVNGTLTVATGGVVHADCADASQNVLTQWCSNIGMFNRAGAGGSSNSNAAGSAGNTGNTNGSLVGGAGGAGGSGSGGTLAGGAGGGTSQTLTVNNVVVQGTLDFLRSIPYALSGVGMAFQNGNAFSHSVTGGGGGGAGGGDATPTGGGAGGGGGGVLLVVARYVVNNGTMRAKGGAGAARGYGTNPGGGGGGGGGLVLVSTTTFTGTQPTAPGGLGGAGLGTGLAGTAGTAGPVIVNLWGQ